MSPNEKYDVFMCCRLTDDNNCTTPDREYADEIYDQLIKDGVRVFYAPVIEADAKAAISEARVYLVIASENADKCSVLRDYGAVKHTVGGRNGMPADNRVLRITPDDIRAARGLILPGNVWKVVSDNHNILLIKQFFI